MPESKTAPVIRIDLDTIERDADEVHTPFQFNLAGRTITMIDPSDLDISVIADLDTPSEFLRLCIPREDRQFIAEQKVPAWKFRKMITAFQAHYGITGKDGSFIS